MHGARAVGGGGDKDRDGIINTLWVEEEGEYQINIFGKG